MRRINPFDLANENFDEFDLGRPKSLIREAQSRKTAKVQLRIQTKRYNKDAWIVFPNNNPSHSKYAFNSTSASTLNLIHLGRPQKGFLA